MRYPGFFYIAYQLNGYAVIMGHVRRGRLTVPVYKKLPRWWRSEYEWNEASSFRRGLARELYFASPKKMEMIRLRETLGAI
jgi:hypothetical protein